MDNQKLFMYGFYASLIQVVGLLICIVSWLFMFKNLILSSVGVLFGFGIIIKGSAMRFNYKRKSGTIIHRGDW